MAEEYSNLTSFLSRLTENEEHTKDIITNLDSFFLTINGSLIILMQVITLVTCFTIIPKILRLDLVLLKQDQSEAKMLQTSSSKTLRTYVLVTE